ncbi:MAG: exodeoxyribonuclease VII small subunit [Clostridia bacterium]|jgi:exodeoxyribonuclease VII small subunit|nr:exodeoxyribonuclease VII small subunit [Clostridia bacterium]MBQ4341988.1 exodeoxyribonuclease VII small subunit [Clostridia bacterium]
MNGKEIEKLKYEQAFSRLEEIVAAMASASVPLDELMDLYEEGMALSAHCERLLKSYDARLEKVARRASSQEEAAEEGGEE